MTMFEERKDAYERKYANDEEFRFKTQARCTKLVALWAAQKIGLDEAEAMQYAMRMVEESLTLKGNWDVGDKIQFDMKQKGVVVTDEEMDQQQALMLIEAEKQLRKELDKNN